jgi:hypothetical protein
MIKLNAEGSTVDAPEDLLVVCGEELLPLFEPEAAPAPPVTWVERPLPVTEAAELPDEEVTGRKRSVAAKVLQFDEAGTRGVYGGGETKGSGIDHVVVTPLVV